MGFVFFNYKTKSEHLRNTTDYKEFKIQELQPDKQRYLTFLGKLLDTYNDKIENTRVCSKSALEKIKNDSLKKAYDQVDPEMCKKFAADICEFTDPNMFVADNTRAFPVNKILSTKPPTNTNLNCFATNYDCCLNVN